MHLGTCKIDAAYLGSCALSKVYLGVCEVLGGAQGPAFDALVPDPVTGVMTPVLKGIGTVADARGSTYWEKDVDDIYREYAIGELAWGKGRVEENKNTWSEDLTKLNNFVVAGDAVLTDATTVTINSNSDDVNWQFQYTGASQKLSIGDEILFTIKLSPSGTAGGTIALRTTSFYLGVTQTKLVDLDALNEDAEYSFPGVYQGAGGYYRFYFDTRTSTGGSGDSVGTVVIASVAVEKRTGQANKTIPGAYIKTEGAIERRISGWANNNTVTDFVLTRNPGTPLPEAPYAVSGIAATNIAPYSIDMGSFFASARQHTITSTSEIAPNGSLTATVMEDADAGQLVADQKNFNASGGIVFDVGNSYCFSEFIKKSAPGVLHCAMGVTVTGGSGGGRVNRIVFNPNTGAITATLLTDSSGVEDCGEYWRVWLGVTDINDGATVMAYRWNSAYNMDGSATADNSAVGSQTIWGNQVELGLTPTAPIITEGVPVSNAASAMSFDPANHDDTVGIWYVESACGVVPSGIIVHQSILYREAPRYDLNATGRITSIDSDGNFSRVISPWAAGEFKKIATRYGSGALRINVAGVYGSEVAYSGDLGFSGIFNGEIGRQPLVVIKIRNLRRYDSDDESIIDGLMS